MKGKTILVAGASSGIGRATAIYLAEQGATIILCARNEERLKEVAREIVGKSYIYACDLKEEGAAEGVFQFCKENALLLDGMVCSVGIASPAPVRSVAREDIDCLMRTNYFSFVELSKYFYNKKYSVNGASIVAISSLAATYPQKGQVTYAGSKAAMNAAVKVMSKEFLKRKMRVNSILPSYVATPMVEGEVSYGMNNGIENMPLGVIEPQQIAYLVEFLLSDKSKHITGAMIPVSSGV